MSALIAGIDFSSRALHAALIPLDPDDGSDAPPVTLRSFEMPTWKGETTPAFRSVERCRVVRDAMRGLLRQVPGPEFPWVVGHEIVHVCVETPFGGGKGHRPSDNVLREIYGAILASIPSYIERDTILTNEWRSIFVPESYKRAALSDDWKTWAINYAFSCCGVTMDEHQAESYLIARACRARLDKAFAA